MLLPLTVHAARYAWSRLDKCVATPITEIPKHWFVCVPETSFVASTTVARWSSCPTRGRKSVCQRLQSGWTKLYNDFSEVSSAA